MQTTPPFQIEKLQTGIAGFDFVASGGLPQGRVTLLSGPAGSAKTVFAAQFLAEGIKREQGGGVFVTFEESPADIRKNMAGFGWDVAAWESQGKWAFVDVSVQAGDDSEVVSTGTYDLGALLARIEHAVQKVAAKRVSVDSLGAIFTRLADQGVVRRELFRLASGLKQMEVTAVVTAECPEGQSDISRYGVEEFVADNVIVLRNSLEAEKRRRTVEILKFRGTGHQKGEFPFTVRAAEGIVVIPLAEILLEQKSSDVRIASGNAELDALCGGGFFRDSIILVSGATGTGKTLMTAEFIAGAAAHGERCLLFAFEESREQLFRNARGWGMDFEQMERDGKLRVVCAYPETVGLEDHFIAMKEQVHDFRPNRVAVDSLSALERVSTIKGFREFVISLTSFIKHQEVAGLFTSTTASLLGGSSITETHISTITDSIILLRYVEAFGEMKRGVTVLKMRGSMHNKDIREFNIDGHGMHIGKPFRNVSGILAGNPQHLAPGEYERLRDLFTDN